MGSMLLVHAIILILLMKKNPFAMIWHVFDNVGPGFMPEDGRGMNPLLINPWMVVHPPVLFMGYVGAQVIYGFVMSGLINKNFQDWYKPAWSWVLYVTIALGAGLILGGYWAYATLGWGGFWGWDPVENSSLVPWVILTVLLHGLIVQHKKQALLKTNFFMGGLTFILVLYGMFLTRSGVLTDFSVHSFGESGINTYLLLFLLFFLFFFLIFYFKNFKLIKSEKLSDVFFNRETFIILGMMVLFLSALITFIGMSFPIISALWNNPSNVPIRFYNYMHIPIGLLIVLLAGLSVILKWNTGNLKKSNYLYWGTGIAMAASIGIALAGFLEWRTILYIFISTLMIVINGFLMFNIIKSNLLKSGKYLTHVGIGLMFIGIIIAAFFPKSEKLNLPLNEEVKSKLGSTLKFEGRLPASDGRDQMKVKVITDGENWLATPQFYYSEYSQAYMISPDINYNISKDIYIAPIQYVDDSPRPESMTFQKMESKRYADYSIKFIDFETGKHDMNEMQKVSAVLEVRSVVGENENLAIVKPFVTMTNRGLMPGRTELPESNLIFELARINASDKNILLNIYDKNSSIKETLSIEISHKPLMSFVWIGTFFLLLGVSLTMVYRKEASKDKR